jgi:hypothetical protein
MKLALLSCCMLLVAGACSKTSAAEKLAGVYDLDPAAMSAAMLEEAKKMPGYDEATMKPKMEQAAKGMTGSMELKADGTATCHLSMMGMNTDENGTWKAEGDKVSVTTKKDGKDDTREGKVEGQSLKFTETEGGKTVTMIFTRKK